MIEGLTMRDLFALVVASQTDRPKEYVGEENTERSYREHAERCYRIADAMLKARALDLGID